MRSTNNNSVRPHSGTSLLLAALLLSACGPLFDENHECGEGQELNGTYCVDVTADAAADATPEGGSDALVDADTDGGEGGGSDVTAESSGPDIGAPCADQTDCGGDYPYCALRPGEPEGYCTVTGCLAEPSLCPAGYDCLDLSAFGGPDLCAPQ